MPPSVPPSANTTGQPVAPVPASRVSLRERLSALRNLPKLFRLIREASPWMTYLNIVLRILKAAIPLAMLYVGRLIIDEVLLLSQQGGDMNLLWIYVGTECGLAILSDILGRSIALVDSLLGDLFSNRTSVRLMQHAADLDLDQFEDSVFYDKLERARRQTTNRMVLMSQLLTQVQDIITVVFLAAGLVVFNPWLILLLVVTVIPGFLGEAYFNEREYSLLRGWTPERRELDYLRHTGASDETAKEVKIFGLSPYLIQRYRELSDRFFTANRAIATRRAGWGMLLATVGSAGYYAAYIVILISTVRGTLSIGELTFLAGSFSRLRGLLEGMLSRFAIIAEHSLYLQDLFDFFDLQPRIVSRQQARPFPKPIREGFVFEHVGFSYAGSERRVLHDISFELRAGEKLALVGENGAGKTTLVKLLARLYDPTEGRILLDGHDLRDYDLAELRSEIGVIFQDFVRFQMTAGVNIAAGRIDEKDDLARIEHAAVQSRADSVVGRLPDGYNQVLGRRFANGVDLSGGEWQKIALARAYMRDAQLLILDEPTAALDARTEYEVFQRFAELTRGKAAVLISHRFSTVRMADRILVLERGGLLEIGTHEELIEKQGRYSELFNIQAAGYR